MNRVVKGINEALQEKGYVLAKEDEAPDFVVMTHAGLKTRINVTHTRYGWYDPWWGPYGGGTQVSYYEEGSLVIDIIDWNEKELNSILIRFLVMILQFKLIGGLKGDLLKKGIKTG